MRGSWLFGYLLLILTQSHTECRHGYHPLLILGNNLLKINPLIQQFQNALNCYTCILDAWLPKMNFWVNENSLYFTPL